MAILSHRWLELAMVVANYIAYSNVPHFWHARHIFYLPSYLPKDVNIYHLDRRLNSLMTHMKRNKRITRAMESSRTGTHDTEEAENPSTPSSSPST